MKNLVGVLMLFVLLVTMSCPVFAEENVSDAISVITADVSGESLLDDIEERFDAKEDTAHDESVYEGIQVETQNEEVARESENAVNHATSSENPILNLFALSVEVIQTEAQIVPSELILNVFSENDIWLQSNAYCVEAAGTYDFVFPVPEYQEGTKFKVVATAGAEYVRHNGQQYALGEYFTVSTEGSVDENGTVVIPEDAKVSVCPLNSDTWKIKAENFVNEKGTKSDTPYLVWVSKKNYKVSVFLESDEGWECIKDFGCSIGAPNTPTVTGEFKYHQYQPKWYYSGYYVGPVMRFYRGYAIHSTLIKNDGTDYDGRIGMQISLGCVRVRPEDINWLVYYIPMNTKIYVTNE